jgi:thiamine transport system substrate-binding protein
MTNRIFSRLRIGAVVALVGSVVLVACGSDESSVDSLTIIAYDSFTPPEGAFDEFTRRTGIEVEIALAGDTGEMVAKAALTAGNPEGDVIWGVDNTLLSRAVTAQVFDPYVSDAAPIDVDLISSSAGVATPVDFGDVCVNYDIAALDALGIAPPRTWADLADPAYADLLVTPSASASSVGLAFLLASIAEFGDDEWSAFWTALMDNGALVVDGWTEAYYTEFTRYGGTRPLVVSYATSPPAEVIFADPPLADGAPAPTAIVESTCFRQIEYAGVLRGTKHPEEARQLIDYLVGTEFQTLLPESIFVHPSNQRVDLPLSFERYAVVVEEPLTMDATKIEENRQRWVEDWTRLVG